MTVERVCRDLLAEGTLALGDPGSGRTAERHLALYEIARRYPVSVARLVEAHTDAISILHEAGRRPVGGSLYGVWASSGRSEDVRVTDGDDGLTMSGVKPFASGRGLLDRALVTAADQRNGTRDNGSVHGVLLVDLEVAGNLRHDGPASWTTPALADSATGPVTLDQHIDADDIVGVPGWYLDRVGFWHGACGPAACWAGAAAGLADAAEALVDGDPHRRAHLGGLRSCVWMLESLLVAAGDQIDDAAGDVVAARARALALRHRVERGVAEILDRFGQAFGPRPFVGDEALNQRYLDTHLYTRQHHGDRDLASLGAAGNPFGGERRRPGETARG